MESETRDDDAAKEAATDHAPSPAEKLARELHDEFLKRGQLEGGTPL
jgi:hypothetical protein